MSRSADHFARLRELFEEALSLPEKERPDFIARSCGEDAALARELGDLLAATADEAPGLSRAVGDAVADTFDAMTGAQTPERIGGYCVLRLIGHGGMGTVYLAEREDFHQQVAVKVLRPNLASDSVVTRFRAEREILANLNHPNIARLYDGGTTDDGLPYFVMEYIEGENIVAYCDAHGLGLDDRLVLFRQVCDAVQHAHRNLVIHRDIKPGNILVTEAGVPRLLDFGIAKLIRPELARHTVAATVADARLMTPDHASPEQLRGEPVTTATDVYALGLLLYELLTGQRPFRTADTSSLGELERMICENEPVRPSAATDVPAVRRRLTGDLDNIVLTALRKEPERRYPSVAQLSEDVQRFRDLMPVQARPDTVGYRLSRFVARQKLGLAVAAIVLAVVAALIGFYTARLSDERDRAVQAEAQSQLEAQTARRVSDFLTGLFKLPDPRESRGETVTAREILDQGAARIREELAAEPLVQGRLMRTIGAVYDQLGLYAEAEALLLEAVAVHEQNYPQSGMELADSLLALGAVYFQLARYEEARQLGERALGVQAELGVPQGEDYAEVLDHLGTVVYYLDDFESSEDYYRRALAILREAVGEDDARYARVLDHLGLTLQTVGRYEESEKLALEALAIREAVHGELHPSTATSLLNVATLYLNQGRDDEAEPLLERALAIDRRTNGEDHPDVAWDLRTLAALYGRQGRYEEAEEAALESLAIWRRYVGDDHVQVVITHDTLATVYLAAGRLKDAETSARAALAVASEKLGEDHSYTAYGHFTLAQTLFEQQRYEAAREHYAAAWRIRQATEGATTSSAMNAQVGLAATYTELDRHDEAIALYQDWVELQSQQHGEGPELVAALERQAAALEAAGAAEEAAATRARARAMSAAETITTDP